MLEEKLGMLPNKPGVYLFKDVGQRVIYIGKAKDLKHRVYSYFQLSRNLDHKTRVLKEHIQDLDYIVTDNELEALFLESNLVKQEKPKFNINLKDDKAFLHIKITVNDPYPLVVLTRRVLDDGAMYFGPFLPASLARNTIKIINRHFLLRTCTIEIDGQLDRPCLEYHIKRCLGPCVQGLCTQEGYSQAVKDVILFLEGKNEELTNNLKLKMIEASEQQHYEAAAFYRDRIKIVKDLTKKQKAIQEDGEDIDIFAYCREENRVALQLFMLRGGRIVGKREFYWERLKFFLPAQFLRDALQQYYLTAGFIPHQVYLPTEIEDQELMAQWLSKKLKEQTPRRRVNMTVPKRGQKHNMVLLVEKNARIAFESRFKILKSEQQNLLECLQRDLDLPQSPQWIEAVDVSNIQGSESVASVVVCERGVIQKRHFRKYRIKSVEGSDDVQSIYEVVSRRYSRLQSEGAPLPDLILIDGGRGQLHAAYQALVELGIEDVPLASIAKREEIIFLQGREAPIRLPRISPLLHMIQAIRDEAHRFALAYHRKRRSMRDFKSSLDQIDGIGEKRKKLLLRTFGSVAKIKYATIQDLASVVGDKLARRVKAALN